MKVLAFCDVDKGILKDAAGHTCIDEDNYSVDDVLDVMLADGDYELISLYYGADITKEQAEELADKLRERNDECEVELFYGGQPLYPVILSME